METVWMLHVPTGGCPTQVFATYEEAKVEAERLGQRLRSVVYVLEEKAVGHFSAQMQGEEEPDA